MLDFELSTIFENRFLEIEKNIKIIVNKSSLGCNSKAALLRVKNPSRTELRNFEKRQDLTKA